MNQVRSNSQTKKIDTGVNSFETKGLEIMNLKASFCD